MQSGTPPSAPRRVRSAPNACSLLSSQAAGAARSLACSVGRPVLRWACKVWKQSARYLPLTKCSPYPVWPRTLTVTYLGGGGPARHGNRDCVTLSATQLPKERQTAQGSLHNILTRAAVGGRCRSHRRAWTCMQNRGRHLVQGTQSGPREWSPLLKAYAGLSSAFGCLLQNLGVAQCDQAPAVCATARSQRAQRLSFLSDLAAGAARGLACSVRRPVLCWACKVWKLSARYLPLTVSSP